MNKSDNFCSIISSGWYINDKLNETLMLAFSNIVVCIFYRCYLICSKQVSVDFIMFMSLFFRLSKSQLLIKAFKQILWWILLKCLILKNNTLMIFLNIYFITLKWGDHKTILANIPKPEKVWPSIVSQFNWPHIYVIYQSKTSQLTLYKNNSIGALFYVVIIFNIFIIIANIALVNLLDLPRKYYQEILPIWAILPYWFFL